MLFISVYNLQKVAVWERFFMLEIVFNRKCTEKCDVKVIGLAEKQRFCDSEYTCFLDKEECRFLQRAIKAENFQGKSGTTVETYSSKGRLMAVGLGCRPRKLDLRKVGGSLVRKLAKNRVAKFWVDDVKGCGLSKEEVAHNFAFGMLLGSYRFDKYFTKKPAEEYPALEKVYFDSVGKGEISLDNFVDMASLANAVRYARDLVNEPANFLTPEAFAADVERLRYLKLDVDILDEKELRKQDFNMLLEVAKGSETKPRVGVIVWHGDKRRKETDVVLVGKGVTYDAGGINLKDRKNLANMYADMAGAAAVAATMKSIALERRVINVAAVVGLVENMPSGKALHPFDVIRSMSGQTVEVTDTDGEGRLLLADLLWYAQERFKPARIIDIATLTGSVAYALAGQYAGIFGNDKKLIRALTESGVECGEPLWELPLNETFDKWINSDVADMKNVGKNVGDGSQAAAFLQRYIKKGVSWAHIDMADMEIAGEDTELCPKGATGFGVQLLNQYLKNLGTEK